MPQELKDQERSEATKLGIQKTKEQPPSSEVNRNIQDMVECSNCHMGKHPNEIKFQEKEGGLNGVSNSQVSQHRIS